MNLMFLNSIDEETYGGMEEWIRLVASGLKRHGHQIAICGRENSEFLKRLSRSHPDLDLVRLEISGDFNPRTITKIKNLIDKRNIETVLVNFNKDIRLGGLAAKLSGEVSVIWSVGLDITKDNLAHKLLTPRLIDGVIVPSQSLKRQITRHGYIAPESVRVIPIGIPELTNGLSQTEARENLARRFALPHGCTVCVTCGRLVEQKGHEYLIDAAPQIVGKNPNAVFLFLGDGPLRKKLETRIAGLEMQKSFIFAGMVNDVAEVLSGCDLMIHPSIEEPFGIALLEGMRAGLPVVATRVGGIAEVVTDNETGLLIEPRQPEAVASAVSQLLAKPAFLKQMGESGIKRWQNNFKYEMMLDAIEEYLSAQSAEVREYGKT